ncbi:MAG TPA: tungstate ABC transporter substrate-binding protein WtpA [Thermoplasmata archaeon]|nr:tungstate ABC transporter substrate-binding protein WtpA [Thermoplasmata archaeon]
MNKKIGKTLVLLVIAAMVFTIFSGCIEEKETTAGPTELVVYHAGSLLVPFEKIEEQFEAEYPNIDVQRHQMGSVKAVRQVTDVGKECDVIAVADYTLIPDMMYPEYADWYIQFARNEVVLAYNPEKSRYAGEITSENWYDILRKSDVIFGFSNPNDDPCGYRAVMVLQLAELYYNDSKIFDDLILKNTAITITEDNGAYLIKTPEDLKPNIDKVNIRPKSVELIGMLEEGGIDYAFEYRSVAVQHNLKFVDLPEQIDLSKVEYEDIYKKVKFQTIDGKIKTAKPIIYGISVPKNVLHSELGVEFIKFIIGEKGQKIFEECGQPPIIPAVESGNVPKELRR